jgi:site-specific DNA recombinase
MSQQTRAALYARASTEKQCDSVPGQLERLEPLAAARGLTVTAHYADDGITGGTTARPGLQRLLTDAKAGRFSVLLVDALDRLARLDLLDLGEVLSPLRRAGVRLITIAEGDIDLTTQAGRIIAGLKGEQGAGERISIARRTLNGMRRHAAERPMGGAAPVGYRWRREEYVKPGRGICVRIAGLEVEPERAPHVLYIYNLAADGHGRPSIRRKLWEAGIPSPTGKERWSPFAVLNVLHSDVYLGLGNWNQRGVGKVFRLPDPAADPAPAGSPKSQRNPREKWVVREQKHEPIVTPELAARARAGLAARNKRKGGKGPSASTAAGGCLSGLLLCGRCGERLHAERDRGGRRAYSCPRGGCGCVRCAVKEKELLPAVLGALAGLASPERRRALHDEVQRLAREQLAGLDRPAARKREERLRAQIDGALDKLALLSRESALQLDARIAEWRRELELLETARREAEGIAARWEDLASEAERLLLDLAGPDALERALADPAGFRLALGRLVASVEVKFRDPGAGDTDRRRKAFWDGGEVVLAVGGTLSLLLPECREVDKSASPANPCSPPAPGSSSRSAPRGSATGRTPSPTRSGCAPRPPAGRRPGGRRV